MTETKLDDFTTAYIEAALWSTSANIGECEVCDHVGPTDGNDRCSKCGGETYGTDKSMQDRDLGIENIDPATLAEMIEDCRKFQEENADVLAAADCSRGSGEYTTYEQAGHDFWLTREGHGAGFWDGDWDDENNSGDKLDEAAKGYNEFSLYVGDDGKIYH